MKMAATAARGQLRDGPISKFLHNRLGYLCAKFGAFLKKCTIGSFTRPTKRRTQRTSLYIMTSLYSLYTLYSLYIIID